MGEPAVFLRLNECNLSCSYCDTPYTWKRADPGYAERRQVELPEVATLIADTAAGRCTRLVLTGGEPLLQQRVLARLCDLPVLAHWDIEIETNGTVVPEAFRGRSRVQINCSPKLSNAGVSREKRLEPLVLQSLSRDYFTYFKFVVKTEAHVLEIVSDFMPLLTTLPPDRIYLSPEGIDVATIDAIRQTLTPLAELHGFKMGDRQHIRKFGNIRRT